MELTLGALTHTHKHNTGKLWNVIDTSITLIMVMDFGTINHYNNSGKQHGSSLKIKTTFDFMHPYHYWLYESKGGVLCKKK